MGKMAQRSAPAPFLTKTYQLVEDDSIDDVISWSESGATFVVWKTANFANDLLPKFFKHNNFSSFVRQLNTYGFRKTVPDKWEFANDNFKQGQKELLIKIRRRKTATSTPTQGKTAGKSAGVDQLSPSNSGEDGGSTSTSSPDSKNPGSVETAQVTQVAELSEENQKLKKDNQILNYELAETKKQCDDLVGFLTKYLKVGRDQIDLIMCQGSCASTQDGSTVAIGVEDDKGGKSRAEEEGESLKLFGVWLVEKKTKRLRDDERELNQPHPKSLKSVGLHAPLGRGGNVCT